MSRSATPATRNEATRRLKPPKRTTSAKLPIGTAIRSSHERLRTVATVNATSSEHTLNPQTPRVKREPLLRIREIEGTNSRQKRPQPQPPHTRGTFHRRLQPLYTEKHKVSCSGLLPKTKPIEHSCSHYNAFRSITWLTRTSLRTWQHQMTTMKQPFQCNLPPESQETQRTTHTGTTTRCKTHRRNQFATEATAAATAAHTRYLSSPAATTLHGKTQGFVLRLPPQNKAH